MSRPARRPVPAPCALRALRHGGGVGGCIGTGGHWLPLAGAAHTLTQNTQTRSLTHTHSDAGPARRRHTTYLLPPGVSASQSASQQQPARPRSVGVTLAGSCLQDERGPNPLFVVHPCICIWTGARAAPVAAPLATPLAVPALHFRATRSLHALKSLEIGGIALNRTQI